MHHEGRGKNYMKIQFGDLKERVRVKDSVSIGGKKWSGSSNSEVRDCGSDPLGLEEEPATCCCKHGNKICGSLNTRNFLPTGATINLSRILSLYSASYFKRTAITTVVLKYNSGNIDHCVRKTTCPIFIV